jgi:predicted Zn-dependent protease
MVSFMKKLQQKGNAAPEFLSTHPLTQNRIVALQKSIPNRYLNVGEGLDSQAYNQRIGRRSPAAALTSPR